MRIKSWSDIGSMDNLESVICQNLKGHGMADRFADTYEVSAFLTWVRQKVTVVKLVRGKFWPKSSARFLARTACLCVGTSFFAHKIDRRHDDLTAAADQKSLDLPSPRVGIWQSPYKVNIEYK
jgi:hypothetical protein